MIATTGPGYLRAAASTIGASTASTNEMIASRGRASNSPPTALPGSNDVRKRITAIGTCTMKVIATGSHSVTHRGMCIQGGSIAEAASDDVEEADIPRCYGRTPGCV